MSERVSSEELQRMVTNHQGDGDLAYACDCPWCRVCLDAVSYTHLTLPTTPYV